MYVSVFVPSHHVPPHSLLYTLSPHISAPGGAGGGGRTGQTSVLTKRRDFKVIWTLLCNDPYLKPWGRVIEILKLWFGYFHRESNLLGACSEHLNFRCMKSKT